MFVNRPLTRSEILKAQQRIQELETESQLVRRNQGRRYAALRTEIAIERDFIATARKSLAVATAPVNS